jgi:glycosyltransferase involved in cell wall biosynthesis
MNAKPAGSILMKPVEEKNTSKNIYTDAPPSAPPTIIIPIYNETDRIQVILQSIAELDKNCQTILVDDGSIEEKPKPTNLATIRSHPYNLGSGAAIKSGIRAAKTDVLVFMDADGQHDPADIPKLMDHINRYDMVVGMRSKAQQASWGRGLMNLVYNKLASYVTGFKVQDLTSGFRAVRAETARALLPLLPNGYSWPTTMTLVMLRSGMSVKYVPINVRPRQHGRSRIRPMRDGIRFFMIIMKICTLYSPFRIFLPVAGTMFGLGLINYAYTFVTAGRFTNMSAVLFTSAVIVFMMGLVSEQISQISLLRQQVQPRERFQKQEKDDDSEGGAA